MDYSLIKMHTLLRRTCMEFIKLHFLSFGIVTLCITCCLSYSFLLLLYFFFFFHFKSFFWRQFRIVYLLLLLLLVLLLLVLLSYFLLFLMRSNYLWSVLNIYLFWLIQCLPSCLYELQHFLSYYRHL